MKKLTVSQKVDGALLWIESLSQPEYPQNSEEAVLGNLRWGFCCLGLGCFILGKEYDAANPFPKKGVLEGLTGLLDYQGTCKRSEERKIIFGKYGACDLAGLNDSGTSFSAISGILKKYPHSYFEPEVAEVIKLAYS